MKSLRTADARFTGLPDFPFDPHYAEIPDQDGATLRVAWVEDGPADGPVALLLHGEPSWSFLYRTVIPVLAAAGIRAIAPDLVGFGRSDKPTEPADHTYARHVEWVRSLAFDVLDLRDITLVGQDWGGLIGLRLAAEHPKRFAAIVATNTELPTGISELPPVFYAFARSVATAAEAGTLNPGGIVASGCKVPPTDEVRAAYNAPFPDASYTAGPTAMPTIVPTTPDDPAAEANQAAWDVLGRSDIPVLCAFSDGDFIHGAQEPVLRAHLPGAAGREHPTITDAGHYLQEDAGPALGAEIVRFMADLR